MSRNLTNKISLAQWALVNELRAGEWTNLDFPRIAREDFQLDGIEFVNTFFAVPTASYLNELKQRAADQGVKMLLIMVDDEGDGCEPLKKDQQQFCINHRKWIDIAQYLGCTAIRTNCRGPLGADPEEALDWASASYQELLAHAHQANVQVLIENHGGLSNDPDWMVRLFEQVNDPFFGSYPDWREPAVDFDNVDYLSKLLPYAKGMSYRNQPDDELSIGLINICKRSGYAGWYGIESDGRPAIQRALRLLRGHL